MKAARLIASVLAALLCLATTAAAEDDSSIVYHFHQNEAGKIALTFDDGPHPRYTHEILAILAEYDIRATFFVIGENVEFYPDALAEIQAGGHELGNHTYDHTRLSHADVSRIRDEILHTETVVEEACDIRTKLFRPPEGSLPPAVLTAARDLDYRVILWNIDTRDWDHTPPDTIAAEVTDRIKAGDIILMHDYIGHDSPTPEALRLMLPRLLEAGYHFVTVSELIGSK